MILFEWNILTKDVDVVTTHVQYAQVLCLYLYKNYVRNYTIEVRQHVCLMNNFLKRFLYINFTKRHVERQ